MWSLFLLDSSCSCLIPLCAPGKVTCSCLIPLCAPGKVLHFGYCVFNFDEGDVRLQSGIKIIWSLGSQRIQINGNMQIKFVWLVKGQNTSSCILLSVWIWASFLALNCPTNSKIHIQTFHIIWLLYYSQLLSSFFVYLVWKWGSHVTSWLKTPHCFDGLFWYGFDTVIAKI